MHRFAVLLIGLMAAAAFAADGGKTVDDPYSWLEDIHGESPLAWVEEQNQRSLAVLKADPRYLTNYESILKVLDATDRIPYGDLDHQYVFSFWQDAGHPKGVWQRVTIADYTSDEPQWDILIDLDKLAAEEKENWVWKGADCNDALTRCLVSLSRGGGDALVVREFDLATKAFVLSGFYLAEAKSEAVFLGNDTVYFSTDFGPGTLTVSGYPRIVKVWHRGEKIADAKTVLEGKTSDVAVSPAVLRNGGQSLAVIVRAVSFFEQEYYLPNGDGSGWQKFPIPLSAQLQGYFRGHLLFTLRDDWQPPKAIRDAWEPPFNGTIAKGSLIAVPAVRLGVLVEAGYYTLYTPGPRSTIDEVVTGRDAVYASIYDNVVGSVRVFRFADGKWSNKQLALPAGGSTSIISANDFGPEVHFIFESFLKPSALYADDGSDQPVEIKSLPARFDASGLETVQYQAVSRDGTKIPYFVVRAKNAKGPRPTILYGYGGFEISETPSYLDSFGEPWLTKGGVFVTANIRGGGEFGPAWHKAALKTHRQRAFDDFAAVAADLIKRKITTPAQLGIMGESNGGLLVSTVMIQHPELLGAVVCQVPLTDMIAYSHIGAGASWEAEYGDPRIPKERAAILKYSPYQNVSAGKKYPPVLFVTATSDDRVTPVHARKMAAKMEGQGHSVLFYENTDGGHAAAADHKQAAEMWALSFVYLARELGLGG